MVRVKVPYVMKIQSCNITNLMHKDNIAHGTAYQLSKGKPNAISFEVLELLCKLFNVQVEDVLGLTKDEI